MFVRVKRPSKVNPLPPLERERRPSVEARTAGKYMRSPELDPAKPDIDIDQLNPADEYLSPGELVSDGLVREEGEHREKTEEELQAEAVRAEEERNLGEAVNNFVMNAAQDAWRGDAELTQSQVSAYKELFDLFDANGDGSISVDELGHVFRIHLGKALAEDDLNRIIDQVDADKNKSIEFDEFLELMASDTWADIEKNEIIKAFSVFDRNKDGYVDAEELRMALTTYGEAMTSEEANEMLSVADLDHNGLIDYSEFLAAMTSKDGSVMNCRQQ